ncbi:hypothetical protein B0T26DRAFT_714241, partial [Lasiosphaeria miniovina]
MSHVMPCCWWMRWCLGLLPRRAERGECRRGGAEYIIKTIEKRRGVAASGPHCSRNQATERPCKAGAPPSEPGETQRTQAPAPRKQNECTTEKKETGGQRQGKMRTRCNAIIPPRQM